MTTKSHGHTSSTENDTLVRVARTIGSALGTIAGKINRAPKTVRRRRKALKTRVARKITRTVSAAKARTKRRR
jgi:hypothetical protein